MKKPISISLSPNTDADDVYIAWDVLTHPGMWREGKAIGIVSRFLSGYFSTNNILLTISGRSALSVLLSFFHIGGGSEVLIQAFTCVVVPNSIRFAQATPVYVDIDATLNMDPSDMEKKITKRTKAVIVQHTFGNPADMDRIMRIAKRHNLVVIEDCAHSFGSSFHGKRLGTIGDGAIISFGRDKVYSSVFGGAAIVNKKTKKNLLAGYDKNLVDPPGFFIVQQLFHPLAFFLIMPLYDVWYIGKGLLWMMQKLHLLSFPVSLSERQGKKPVFLQYRYPNALATLLVNQLNKFERYKDMRLACGSYYDEALAKKSGATRIAVRPGAVLLRYPLFVSDPGNVRAEAKKHHMLLGNWYHSVVDPAGSEGGYEPGRCPNAEYAARHIINLPTRIPISDARNICTVL